MPFFPRDRILFIHIPKTGGTSVETYFSSRSNIQLDINSLYFRYTHDTIKNEVNKYKNVYNNHMKTLKTSKTSNTSNTSKTSKDSNTEFYFRRYKIASLVKEYSHSLHHFTWNEIRQSKDILLGKYQNAVSNNMYERNSYEIITIVRNPYDRVVSDLLFNHIINNQTINDNEIVYKKLKKYLEKSDTFDNHKIPQYMYIIDELGEIINNITILRTETLTSDMKLIGFSDFNHNLQKSKCNIESKNTKYISVLNTDSIKLINNYYKRDFELFGYTMIS